MSQTRAAARNGRLMALPALERPPGIPEPWHGLWRASLKQLQTDGTWRVALRPLLDRYIEALRRSHELRLVLDDPECTFAQRDAALLNADREERRAIALAGQLGLTVTSGLRVRSKPRKDADGDEKAPEDPFAKLDELAPRRANRAQASPAV